MIEISVHIEQLLLHHDCVIVPGLGGFVAQDCSATYIMEEDTFLPPYRNVSFNPRLTMNDGLLVQHITQEYGMGYDDAMQYVRLQVEKIHKTISHEGAVAICGVGTLKASPGRSYEFTPLLCGILSPRHYGLDSLYAPAFHAEEPEAAEKEEDEETITLKIGMNALRYAAAVAVATLFYFIAIAPLHTAIVNETTEAGVFHQLLEVFTSPTIEEESAKTTTTTNTKREVRKAESTPKAAETAPCVEQDKATPATPDSIALQEMAEARPAMGESGSGNESVVQDAAPTPEALAPAGKPYTIVLASAITRAGAEKMVEDMKHFGDETVRVVTRRKMTRVVYSGFDTMDEAQEALRRLRTTNSVFNEAWVLKME